MQTENTQNPQIQPLKLIGLSDFKVTATNHLIKGFLECDTNTVIYGESGAGKSFLTLDAAFAVAAATINPNISFFGMPISEPGSVIYACGEGQNGIAKRIEGLKGKYGVDSKDIPFFMTQGSVILNNTNHLSSLLMTCEQVKAGTGSYPKMIIFDTLNKSFNGNENSADDVGQLVRAMDELRRVTGACVVIVHHTGKGGEMRGSSALRAGIDNQIGVFLDEEDSRKIVIKNEKMKDNGEIEDLKLVKEIVKVGYDERYKEDITTLILKPEGLINSTDKNTSRMSAEQKEIIKIIDALGDPELGIEELKFELSKRTKKTITNKFLNQTIQKLISRGLISISEDNQFLELIK